MNLKVQESLRRIREAAKKSTAEKMGDKSIPTVDHSTKEIVKTLKKAIESATQKAIITKMARNYVADLLEKIQIVSNAEIQTFKLDDLGNAVRDKTGAVVLYPNNCRLLVENENGSGVVVIEDAPQLRTIFINNEKTARISLPYLVFTISFSKKNDRYYPGQCGVGFRSSPLTSIDDKLGSPALPHCDILGICQPLNNFPKNGVETISQIVDEFMNSFWNSAFVYTLQPFKVGKIKIKCFKDWEDLKNPLDILHGNFASHDMTVRKLVNEFGGRQPSGLDLLKVEKLTRQIQNNISKIDPDVLSQQVQKTVQQILHQALKDAFEEEKTPIRPKKID